MFLGEVLSVFHFFLVAFSFLYCSSLFVGICPFGNKFLLIQRKNKMDPHPKPYKLCWLQEGSDIKVKHRRLVFFTIGKHYQDEVCCDVVPMDVCHLLLGRPWQYDS